MKQAIYKVASTGRDVVVLMHSFGGVSGSDAVAEFEEDMKTDDASSKHGRVVQLLYVAAIVIDKGTAFASHSRRALRTEVKDGLSHFLAPVETFYNSMEPALAQQCAARILPHTVESFATPAKHRGWADYRIPVTYIACENDQALLIDTSQLEFMNRIESSGIKVNRVRLLTDHTPWMNNNRNEFFNVLWDVLDKASLGKTP